MLDSGTLRNMESANVLCIRCKYYGISEKLIKIKCYFFFTFPVRYTLKKTHHEFKAAWKNLRHEGISDITPGKHSVETGRNTRKNGRMRYLVKHMYSRGSAQTVVIGDCFNSSSFGDGNITRFVAEINSNDGHCSHSDKTFLNTTLNKETFKTDKNRNTEWWGTVAIGLPANGSP